MTAFAHYPSLMNRTVLITGGATGIGATLVEQFVAQGAKVGFIDIDAAAGRALADSLRGASTPPLFIGADLTDTAALRAAIDSVRTTFGPITALLNNAANDQRHGFDSVTPDGWDATIAVNLKHQYFAAQAVVPDMRAAGGGSIVNFGSMTWKVKQAGLAVYATSKAAVQGMTRALARELGPHRIRVNTLVPGWVMTDKQLRLWVTPDSRADIARGQCIDAPLQPLHIAHMALFLAADDSAMCTAQDFVVDAGWT